MDVFMLLTFFLGTFRGILLDNEITGKKKKKATRIRKQEVLRQDVGYFDLHCYKECRGSNDSLLNFLMNASGMHAFFLKIFLLVSLQKEL